MIPLSFALYSPFAITTNSISYPAFGSSFTFIVVNITNILTMIAMIVLYKQPAPFTIRDEMSKGHVFDPQKNFQFHSLGFETDRGQNRSSGVARSQWAVALGL